ncbi:hypothetical protein ASG43_17745 [Aureimonas sp. Leaf454]|nr:hypothetical protein ASG43_17745 [Aureimonas sp. Leaf454]
MAPRKAMMALLKLDADRTRWASLQQAVSSTTLHETAWNDPKRHIAEAHRVMAGLRMTLEEIEAATETVQATNATPCGERQLELLLGVLIDAYANANPPSIEGYLNGLFLSIMRENQQTEAIAHGRPATFISDVAMAAAVARAWDQHKFPPSPSEVLTLCKAAREDFRRALPALRRLDAVRGWAESVLIVSGELTDYSDGYGEGPALLAQFRGLQ